jgi:hypothetical protein
LFFGIWGNQRAGAIGAAQGTRASANTSGPDFTWAKIAGEIADLKIRTERRKLVSSAGPVFGRANSFENAIQPFDLMSRRHPLSSTEPSDLKSAVKKQIVSEGSSDVPASSRRQFSQSEIYFFFLATLRVFFAVFFTALFAFFAFLAFLAMLPS